MLCTGDSTHFPNVLDIGRGYTDQFSGHHRAARCKLGRSEQRPADNNLPRVPTTSTFDTRRLTTEPGPGHYRTDSSFPPKRKVASDTPVHAATVTRSETATSWSFSCERKTA